MARLDEIPKRMRELIETVDCVRFDTQPWVTGPALEQRRIAMISTAGLQMRGDRPFGWGSSDYRVIDGDVTASKLAMSHVSTNFDRTGFQSDINVAFPIDRLRELARDGIIGSVAAFHYSFMGASDPEDMAPAVDFLAPLLKADGVDGVLLVPV